MSTDINAIQNVVEGKIIQLLRELCPDLGSMDTYQLSCVNELCNHFRKMGQVPSSDLWKWQNYGEDSIVSIMDDLVSNIKKDIVEGGLTYLWPEDKDKEGFEKGVFAAIRLIQWRRRCIVD